MNVKNDILEELRSVSELVATISRETPYRVADDYFTDLSNRVMIRIKTQHKPLSFNVPEGYFEGFAEGLLAKIKAGIGSGERAGARPGFEPVKSIPEIAHETAEQELTALSPLLAQLRSMETYRMPEGYFEEVSPLLAVAKELNPYTVPEEYFRRLPVEIEKKRPAKAKVVAFSGRRTRLWQYSAAAVVAGLILTIGWLRLHVPGSHGGKSPDLTAKIGNVSDQDLQSFLADPDEEAQVDHPANNVAALDFNDGDISSLLGDIPDGELKQYMDEHGGAVDIATN
jgi:hypothetical protein